MYLNVMSDIVLFTWSFMVVMSEVGVLTSPGYSSRFPPAMSLVLWVSVFWVQILHTDLTYGDLLYFGLYWWNINLILSVPACYFHPWERLPSSLHIEFFHTGASILTKSMYPRIFPVVSNVMWCATVSTVIVYIFGFCVSNLF